LDSWDLRREPLEDRKAELTTLLRRARPGLQLNEHISGPGDIVFRHACKSGWKTSCPSASARPTDPGRSHDWLKSKNPDAPAVKREAEEVGADKHMEDDRARELFLISVLAAFCSGLAWSVDYELFALVFAAAAAVGTVYGRR
jgi:hypothetical protein